MISLKPTLLLSPPIMTLKTNSSRINPDNIKSGATIRAVSVDYHAEPPGYLSGTETGADCKNAHQSSLAFGLQSLRDSLFSCIL